jgi:hypothetical protein
MKYELFISYSTKDKDKVDLIVEELENHPTLKALVIGPIESQENCLLKR